ncbi:MAG: 5-(carboxyamino)imidazole ribonucleotide mutase [Candidatus Omnitrophota bacterium]
MKNILVSIVMGSESDLSTMEEAAKILKNFGVSYEVKVWSAHRTPDETAEYAKALKSRGVQVVIAGAGGAAALAGVVASFTTIPVLGVPIETTALDGLDSLLSTVQMPAGTPVGTLAIGKPGAKNAAFLALRILSLSDKTIGAALEKYRGEQAEKIKNIKVDV